MRSWVSAIALAVAGFVAAAAIGQTTGAPHAAPPPNPPIMATTGPGAPVTPEALSALVDGVVRDGMARDHIAGVAVSVVHDGQVVFKKGYGFAGPGRPVDPDTTLFHIASISKTFTWIAA